MCEYVPPQPERGLERDKWECRVLASLLFVVKMSPSANRSNIRRLLSLDTRFENLRDDYNDLYGKFKAEEGKYRPPSRLYG